MIIKERQARSFFLHLPSPALTLLAPGRCPFLLAPCKSVPSWLNFLVVGGLVQGALFRGPSLETDTCTSIDACPR